MPTNYPASLDAWTNPAPTTKMDAAGFEHDVAHSDVFDALEAIEAELGTDPKGALASVRARLELLHRAAGYVTYASARWYGAHSTNTTSSSLTVTATRLYVIPMWIPYTLTFDRIGMNISTAVASAQFRLGLYGSTADLFPGALVVDAGTVGADTTGAKELVINQTLNAGVYWLAAVSGHAPGATSTTGGAYRAAAGGTTANATPSTGYTHDSANHIVALPDPFPTPTTFIASTLPMIQMRTA